MERENLESRNWSEKGGTWFQEKKLMQKSKKWLFPDVCGASPTEGKKGGITDQLGVWVLENNTDQGRSQPDPFGTRVGPT